MYILEKESKQTYTDKSGKERNYVNYYLVCDNGKSVQIKCAFSDDYTSLALLSACGCKEVSLIKKQSKSTYKNKDNVECHYYNYYLSIGNMLIQIRCAYAPDYARLDMVAVYSHE